MIRSNLNKISSRVWYLVGWLLSPLTFWNDAFVNIPLAYLCGNIMLHMVRVDFLHAVLVFYWLSNILGLALMWISGKSIIGEGGNRWMKLAELVITVLVYSGILALLDHFGALKPLLK